MRKGLLLLIALGCGAAPVATQQTVVVTRTRTHVTQSNPEPPPEITPEVAPTEEPEPEPTTETVSVDPVEYAGDAFGIDPVYPPGEAPLEPLPPQVRKCRLGSNARR
jgi:hypothetical protein